MTDLFLSDDELDGFRSAPKQVTNPKARWLVKSGRHRQKNFAATSEDGSTYRIYLRENLEDNLDFSCGLSLVRRSGKSLSLARYNGPSHVHCKIRYRCHVHRATAKAILAGRKIDNHAEETDRYRSLEGAFACLIEDCGVQGLSTQHDERDLFDGS